MRILKYGPRIFLEGGLALIVSANRCWNLTASNKVQRKLRLRMSSKCRAIQIGLVRLSKRRGFVRRAKHFGKRSARKAGAFNTMHISSQQIASLGVPARSPFFQDTSYKFGPRW